jgi:cobyrinic acid a,c-diamide synthase
MGFNKPRLAIAGLSGDSGKTLVSLSIISALKQRQYSIAPFKKGPDYIDAAWLASISQTTCYNLDTFLVKPAAVLKSFIFHSADKDLALIEGNRGLFDGRDVYGSNSTANLAKLTATPILLVINTTKTTRTVAAMVKGIIDFDPEIKIAGIILNQVAGIRHENIISKAINKYCGVPVVGVIPKIKKDSDLIPGRHLGLVTPSEFFNEKKLRENLLNIAEKYLDINRIIRLAKEAKNLSESKMIQRIWLKQNALSKNKLFIKNSKIKKIVKIGYFKDSVFTFYYPENLEALQREGAILLPISSLTEQSLPELDGLYIGGGFPETQADSLSKNIRLLKSVKENAELFLPIYAECGGLIFLSRTLFWNNKFHKFSNVLPVDLTMNLKPMGHGYMSIKVDKANPFYKENTLLKGHEFHYSTIISQKNQPASCMKVLTGYGLGSLEIKLNDSKPKPEFRDGLIYKNVLATYVHIHADGVKVWARNFIKSAQRYKERSNLRNCEIRLQ